MDLPAPHIPLDPGAVGRSLFSDSGLPAAPEFPEFVIACYVASGGFGHVWKATPRAGGPPVALKVPHHCDHASVDRMEQEAGALQALTHPNIVRLLEFAAAENGSPLLVMEYVDGPPLTRLLPREGFSFQAALQYLLPVLDAVAHAHARGIVHRDLKPSNILIAADGTPKITDFGLAQSLENQRVNFTLTRSGALAGTVEYLAPERYEPGTKAGTAADIYALGIILYELLTGIPPRGAWQPPSRIKQLDVRLDELILEAIHADPAKRLPSAEAFAKRLTEIRDTRPRYSGTPLFTRAIRISDCLWTLGGLYGLSAGFCSLQSMNNTAVPGLLDLTFGHAKLLGGYWALWMLCLLMGVLWMWQAIRLWRFRHIPLREALPAPFGLRPGHSRGGAAIVCAMQILCVWLPLVYMGWIYSQCWYWAGPDSAPWEKVLAITRWGSEVPLSQWTWAPEGMFSGDEFWIREMQPGLHPGEWRLLDRQSFFVVTQPLLMTLGVAAIAIGLTGTIAACFVQWLPRKPWHLAALALLAGLCVFAVMESVTAEEEDRRRFRSDPGQTWSRLEHDKLEALFPVMMQIFDHSLESVETIRERVSLALADQILVSDTRTIGRDDFIRDMEKRRGLDSAYRTVEARRLIAGDGTSQFVPAVIKARVFDSPPGEPVTATFVTASLNCRRTPPEAAGTIDTWIEETTPLYTATAEPLTESAATTWLATFLQALSTRDQSALHALLLPVMLQYDPLGAGSFPHWPTEYQAAPAPREQLTTPLLASLHRWPSATFTAIRPPAFRPLPGARWELTCPLRQTGTRPDGGSACRDLTWPIELVFSGGQWQALRVRM